MMHLTWLINRITAWITDGRGFPCLFHLLTGFYCPGCGGTRAVRLMLQGHWLLSLQYHPFVLYVLLIAGTEFLIFLRMTIRKKQKHLAEGLWGCWLYGMQRRYPWWVSIGAVIVVMNWIVKNICLGMGIDLLPPL